MEEGPSPTIGHGRFRTTLTMVVVTVPVDSVKSSVLNLLLGILLRIRG